MYADLGVIPNQEGLRDATDEEFDRIAIMKLRGVPENVISDYARDLGIRYIPPEPDMEGISVNPSADITDTEEETDVSDLFNFEN
jgi:hypothetical protein